MSAVTVANAAPVSVASSSGNDLTQSAEITVVESLDILSMKAANGGFIVINNKSRCQLCEQAAGINRFLQARLRGLTEHCMTSGFGQDVPFHEARTSTGITQFTDLATGRRITLDAFDQTNTRVFAKLLSTGAN
ncbi:MAG: photosynthetic complex assembly protein PuhC [Pseudomonadota bacterium]